MAEEFARFAHQGSPAWGLRREGRLHVLRGAPWARAGATGASLAEADVELLAPTEPGKIVCVGINYRDHALEMGHPLPAEPLIFLKPASSLLAPGKAIRLPPGAGRVDHEAELALVIGATAGPAGGAEGALFGYTCANDVTARDLQKKDGQWTRAKGFDTFCPLGPYLVRKRGSDDAADWAVQCRVNGGLRQDSRTSQLVFTPERLIRFVAGIMTLEPGDLILTGTPAGIGPLEPGDRVEVRIEGVGVLENPVL